MEKPTLQDVIDRLNAIAERTLKDFENLSMATASGFEETATKKELQALATKDELRGLEAKMKAGFSMTMEAINPLRRDYEALKDDLVPEVENLKGRVAKVERKVATL